MKKAKLLLPVMFVVLVVLAVSVNSKATGEKIYTGVVEADSSRISAETGGTVFAINASEGQKISKGDVLVKIDDEALGIEKEKIEGLIRIGELQFEKLKEGARNLELQGAENDVKAMESQVRIALEECERAKDTYDDFAVLYAEGAISEADYEKAGTNLRKATEQLESATEMKNKSRAAYGLLLEGADEKSLAIAYEELQIKRTELRSMELQLKKASIEAPFDGILRECFVQEGEFVPKGAQVAVLDKEAYHIKFFLPEKDLDKIEIGDGITMDFNGRTVPAEVTYISDSGEFTPKNIESSESKEEIVFRARAELLENPKWVKAGMFVDVQIEGGK